MSTLKKIFPAGARAARSLIDTAWKKAKRAAANAFDTICTGVSVAWSAVVRPVAELLGATTESLDRVESAGDALRVGLSEAASRSVALLESDVHVLWADTKAALRAASARMVTAARESWNQILEVLSEALEKLRGTPEPVPLPVVIIDETPPSASQVPIPS